MFLMELIKTHGRLMAIGGGEDKEKECLILKRFVKLAGDGKARIVVMTTATTPTVVTLTLVLIFAMVVIMIMSMIMITIGNIARCRRRLHAPPTHSNTSREFGAARNATTNIQTHRRQIHQ